MEYSVIQSERESGSWVRVLWSRVSDMASRELSLVASHFLGERGEREGNKNFTPPTLSTGWWSASLRLNYHGADGLRDFISGCHHQNCHIQEEVRTQFSVPKHF